MSTIADIAGAVAWELNNKQWKISLTAWQWYRPRFEVEELDSLRVSVVPRSLTIEADGRAYDSREYRIDVAIQKKLKDELSMEIDELIGLVEDIARHFRLRRLTTLPGALCVKIENDPIYAIEHLEELRCFTSILTLTFRMID